MPCSAAKRKKEVSRWRKERGKKGTSLDVQWLRLCASTAEDMGLIPGQETKISHATGCSLKRRSRWLLRAPVSSPLLTWPPLYSTGLGSLPPSALLPCIINPAPSPFITNNSSVACFSPVLTRTEFVFQFCVLILREIPTSGWRGNKRYFLPSQKQTTGHSPIERLLLPRVFLHFLEMTQRDNEWVYVFENISCFEKGVTDKGSEHLLPRVDGF